MSMSTAILRAIRDGGCKVFYCALLTAYCSLFLSGCAGVQSALDPAGPHSGLISRLWWLMLYTLSAVFLVVMCFLLVAAFRPRAPSRNDTANAPDVKPEH